MHPLRAGFQAAAGSKVGLALQSLWAEGQRRLRRGGAWG